MPARNGVSLINDMLPVSKLLGQLRQPVLLLFLNTQAPCFQARALRDAAPTACTTGASWPRLSVRGFIPQGRMKG